MAPNITDILYYLKSEDMLVGVDRFSKKKVNHLPIVGDLVHIDYEKLLALKPDVVFLTIGQKKFIKQIKKLTKAKVLSIDIRRLKDLNPEIEKVAKTLEVSYKEINIGALLGVLGTTGRTQKALVVIDRGKKNLSNLFVAGYQNFIDELLPLLNLVNAMTIKNYPKLNIENIMALNPDVIIDLTHQGDMSVWNKYSQIKAVKQKQVYKGDLSLTVPSPFVIDAFLSLKKKMDKRK